MKKITFLVITLFLGLGFNACNKDSKDDSTGSIGIPICDEYLSKYQKCLEDKVPAETKDAMKQAFQKGMQAWQAAAQAVQDDASKAALVNLCQEALEQAKAATDAYGCEF